MKKIKTYENKNILILGLGKSGFSVAKLLLKLGAKLTLNDKKDLSNDDRAAELDKLGVRVISMRKNLIILLKTPEFLMKIQW